MHAIVRQLIYDWSVRKGIEFVVSRQNVFHDERDRVLNTCLPPTVVCACYVCAQVFVCVYLGSRDAVRLIVVMQTKARFVFPHDAPENRFGVALRLFYFLLL